MAQSGRVLCGGAGGEKGEGSRFCGRSIENLKIFGETRLLLKAASTRAVVMPRSASRNATTNVKMNRMIGYTQATFSLSDFPRLLLTTRRLHYSSVKSIPDFRDKFQLWSQLVSILA